MDPQMLKMLVTHIQPSSIVIIMMKFVHLDKILNGHCNIVFKTDHTHLPYLVSMASDKNAAQTAHTCGGMPPSIPDALVLRTGDIYQKFLSYLIIMWSIMSKETICNLAAISVTNSPFIYEDSYQKAYHVKNVISFSQFSQISFQ